MPRSVAVDRTGSGIAVVDENVVRGAAGLTMVVGAVAFSYAYFAKQYIPLRIAASLFFADFLLRLTAGLGYSPVGAVARWIARGRRAEWVPLTPKRFAWTLGLGMALAMTVITNVGIRGWLPRTICLICLTLMWMESVLGLCVGCRIYGALAGRGWIHAARDGDSCTGGVCQPVTVAPEPATAVREPAAEPTGEAVAG
jgi:Domain of unknown function (DUF4395)